ncbi:hypothetical protein [Paenibacillus pinistramenti]|uniref:hypothetical protein n=1 Tax=Paenibacillus pinistramenti TaxID=1768003 RepID=UPI0011084E46|nr:hypothetical protein [Paenibacillus pinistramenti]
MNNEDFSEIFLKITLHRMCDLYFQKLKVTLSGVSQNNLWAESYEDSNTIGGIVLHVCEHIARSCLRLKNLENELKKGFENYFPQEHISSQELMDAFECQLNEWKSIICEFIKKGRPLNEEHIHQLYHLVEHTGYHLGQIIDRVQGITKKKFAFCSNGLNESYLRNKIESDNIV